MVAGMSAMVGAGRGEPCHSLGALPSNTALFLCQMLLGAPPTHHQAVVMMPAPRRREAEKPLLCGRKFKRNLWERKFIGLRAGGQELDQGSGSGEAGATGRGLLPPVSVIAISPRA